MLGILRKDAPVFAIAVFAILPLVLIIERLAGPGPGAALFVLNLLFTWMLTLGPLMIVEQEEERSNGYALLGALPLPAREIAGAKFLLLLAAVAAMTFAQFAFFAGSGVDVRLAAIARAAILLNSAACLVIGGTAYAGIFRFGFTRFFTASAVLVLTLALVPGVILTAAGAEFRHFVARIPDLMLDLSPWTIVLGGLALYAALFLLSLRLRAGGVRRIDGKELP